MWKLENGYHLVVPSIKQWIWGLPYLPTAVFLLGPCFFGRPLVLICIFYYLSTKEAFLLATARGIQDSARLNHLVPKLLLDYHLSAFLWIRYTLVVDWKNVLSSRAPNFGTDCFQVAMKSSVPKVSCVSFQLSCLHLYSIPHACTGFYAWQGTQSWSTACWTQRGLFLWLKRIHLQIDPCRLFQWTTCSLSGALTSTEECSAFDNNVFTCLMGD